MWAHRDALPEDTTYTDAEPVCPNEVCFVDVDDPCDDSVKHTYRWGETSSYAGDGNLTKGIRLRPGCFEYEGKFVWREPDEADPYATDSHLSRTTPVCIGSLNVHTDIHTITVTNWIELNTSTQNNTNNLKVEQSEDGIQLNFGAGTATNARGAFGTTDSNFGFPGNAFFDGQLVKFGNSVDQQLLDFRITNNTGSDAKLKKISFDFRKAPGNPDPTGFQILYLGSGNSELRKGSSFGTGSEMVDLCWF